MNKSIYWIDDDIRKVVFIMQGIFPELWNLEENYDTKKIKSQVIILGDGFKDEADDSLWTTKDEIDLKRKIDDYFFEQCKKIRRNSWEEPLELYKENSDLFKDCVQILFKKWTKMDEEMAKRDEDEIDKVKEKRKNDLELCNEIYSYWKNEKLLADKYNEAKNKVTELINFMGIPREAGVGIDLVLLFGDKDSVKAKHRILSMELYSQLKARENKCFLYSTYAFDEPFIKSWEEVYKKEYENEELKIYDRKQIMQKKLDQEVVKEIRSLVD